MRTFASVGAGECYICKTKKEGEAVLLPMVGTQKGFNAEAKVVHLECLDLWVDTQLGVIYQKLEK